VRLVLDASAAIEVVLNRGKAPHFVHLLEDADEVLAPDLLVSEVVNTFWKYHHMASLDLDTCERGIELAFGLIDALVPAKDLYREAFLLARTTRRSAYDMFYLTLAKREDAGLLTMDAALKKEAVRQAIRVM
jgi:predicted nucleic acid-binding protein